MKSKIFVILLMIFSGLWAAQNIRIQGKVSDLQGSPLADARVKLKSANLSAQTTSTGAFALAAGNEPELREITGSTQLAYTVEHPGAFLIESFDIQGRSSILAQGYWQEGLQKINLAIAGTGIQYLRLSHNNTTWITSVIKFDEQRISYQNSWYALQALDELEISKNGYQTLSLAIHSYRRDLGTIALIGEMSSMSSATSSSSTTVSSSSSKKSQTIDFPIISDRYLSAGNLNLSATATSGLSVKFTLLTDTICQLSGNLLSFSGPGMCALRASQAGDATYDSAQNVDRSFNILISSSSTTLSSSASSSSQDLSSSVSSSSLSSSSLSSSSSSSSSAKQAQSIIFDPIANSWIGLDSVQITISTSSGLSANTTSLSPNKCTVNNSWVRLLDTGACSIVAKQPGNASYDTAAWVQRNFNITRKAQTITFDTIVNQVLQASGLTVSATASSGLAVSFSSLTTSICTLSGNSIAFLGSGVCRIRAEQLGNLHYQSADSVDRSFTIYSKAATPTFGISSGTYNSTQSVTINTTTAGASIYYTTDGSTPTTGSTLYSGAISVNTSQTIKAIAVASGFSASDACSANYVIDFCYNKTLATNEFCDARDGQIYTKTTIGGQIWMSKNLSYRPNSGNYWWYANDSAANSKYGRLYDWNAAMNNAASSNSTPSGVRGLCPTGWHLPSDAEWTVLGNFVDLNNGSDSVGQSLKANSSLWANKVGTDQFLFGGIPGGYYNGTSFNYAGYTAYMWSSTDTATTNGLRRSLSASNDALIRLGQSKNHGFSIRCVNDTATASPVTFNVAAGTYSSTQTVTLSTTTSGATIYYTTDGSTPTTSSTAYTAAITVSSTKTIKAIAVKSGMPNSGLSTAIYTIDPCYGKTLAANEFCDARDGQVYTKTTIGTQIWMAKNLNYGTMVTGQTNGTLQASSEKFCYYDSESTCSTEGGLYQWHTAMGISSTYASNSYTIPSGNVQGICPTGWHIPRPTEWDALATSLGGSGVAGSKMKLNNVGDLNGYVGWDASTYNDGNSSGFSSFPSGFRKPDFGFSNRGGGSYYWESGEYTAAYQALVRRIFINSSSLDNAGYGDKVHGFSVRCVNDTATATPVTFGVAAGTYSSTQTVTLSTPTSGATIYYTTDGSTPTTSSTAYTAAITVSSTKTIKAIATKSGMPTSGVSTAQYRMAADCYGATLNANEFCDSRDGQIYTKTTIGGQIWMAKNLNYGTYISDGASSATLQNGAQKFCYNNNALSCDTLGGLYQWHTSMGISSSYATTDYTIPSGNIQGICPTGWHLPKSTEWSALTTFLGGSTVAGSKMKINNSGQSAWDASTYNDGNSSGFSTAPTGHRTELGGFDYRANSIFFWEAEQYDPTYAWFSLLNDSYSDLNRGHTPKSGGLSIRCINDTATVSPVTFGIATGTYSSTQTVTLSTTTSGATIYYTTDGSTPTTSSTAYTAAITVSSTKTIKAIAAKSGMPTSGVSTASYTIAFCSGTLAANEFCDSRDGNIYDSVRIGTQVWMAKNLSYKSTTTGVWYNNDSTTYSAYGRLYDWATTMALASTCNSTDCAAQVQTNHKGICPTGWHIPTDDEWKTLELYIGMVQADVDNVGWRGTIGTKLRSSTHWTGGYNGTDNYSMKILPAGTRSVDGIYGSNVGIDARLWSATQTGTSYARHRYLSPQSSTGIWRDQLVKGVSMSVRCVKD